MVKRRSHTYVSLTNVATEPTEKAATTAGVATVPMTLKHCKLVKHTFVWCRGGEYRIPVDPP